MLLYQTHSTTLLKIHFNLNYNDNSPFNLNQFPLINSTYLVKHFTMYNTKSIALLIFSPNKSTLWTKNFSHYETLEMFTSHIMNPYITWKLFCRWNKRILNKVGCITSGVVWSVRISIRAPGRMWREIVIACCAPFWYFE